MMMKKSVYHTVINTVPSVPPEAGVIFGEQNNIVSHFHIDHGVSDSELGCYEPNVTLLNAIIKKWEADNIRFLGIAHTHHACAILSSGDVAYIATIMNALQEEYSRLFFPIIIPRKEIVCYAAVYSNGALSIEKEAILLV